MTNVSAVCHGPAALVDVKLGNGEYLVNGKSVTAFTNREEDEVQDNDIVPFLLENALVEHGAKHHPSPNWSENIIIGGRLITGQNTTSAHGVGAAVSQALFLFERE